ncbi:hypothetical protein R84B8_02837 [Treponema sp. R8-4-B8]
MSSEQLAVSNVVVHYQCVSFHDKITDKNLLSMRCITGMENDFFIITVF